MDEQLEEEIKQTAVEKRQLKKERERKTKADFR